MNPLDRRLGGLPYSSNNNFLVYNPESPSPSFSVADVAYISSVDQYLDAKDLEKLRSIETFRINLRTEVMAGDEIPGFRKDDYYHYVYVKRFSDLPLVRMMQEFFKENPPFFPEQYRNQYVMPCWRVTTPDGCKFYPIGFASNIPAWHSRMELSSKVNKTLTAVWEEGRFVTSDGQILRLVDIDVEASRAETLPKGW